MGSANPVTDAERERVRELHAAGRGRNDIATELGRSGRTISEIAKSLGLSFSRATQVQHATEIRQADLAALRAQLAIDFTLDAMRLRERMWQPAKVYNFGGKDNTYEVRDVDEPPAGDKRALMGAAGMATDRSLKLSPPKNETGNEEGLALITQLMSGLTAVHKAQQGQEADEGA